MISELLRRVMLECGLKQQDLASVLDVPLQRVKHLTAGNVKKLTPDETRRLVQTLNLSAHWLATGDGPMFNTMGGEKLGELLTQTKLTATRLAELEGLRAEEARAVMSVVTGLFARDLAALRSGLEAGADAALSESERALLASYRRCKPEGQVNLIQTAALLAAGVVPAAEKAPRKARVEPSASVHVGNMTNRAAGGVQVGYAGGKVSVKKGR